jgi:PAS domain S-box-containing protein
MPVSLVPYQITPAHKRQVFLKRVAVIAGFSAMLILVAGNALIVRNQLQVVIGSQELVAHTREVLFGLERVESLLKDAETGQRGFLYTGEQKYLFPYKTALSQIEPQIDAVAQLTADNPRQQALIPLLHNLAQTKIDELARTISLYQAGKQQNARDLVRSDAGLIAMDNIRELISRMEREETSLEASRIASYQSRIQITILCIYLPSILAGIGLVVLAYFVLLEMKHREEYLHEIHRREQWYRVTLTSIGDAVIATNHLGKVTFLNPIAEKLTGTILLEAAGRDVLEVFPIFNEDTNEPAENPVHRVMEAGVIVGLANHTVLKRADGAIIPIEDSAAPIRDDTGKLVGVVMVFRDVTKERKTLEALRKSERLAAAARLAASVAHEVNNPLEAVVNLVYLAKAAPGAPPSVVEPLIQAEEELERVAHITRRTLGFYREAVVPELIDIPDLVESVLRLHSNKLKTNDIKIVREFDECPLVQGVPGEIKQVISNLITNAAEAVGHDGTITVKTWCVDEPDGQVVHVAVEDDGPGIDDQDVERIFEPFFTTKKDVGTGLGLWVTREIVVRHGGTIQVNPRKDGTGGAVFRVLLPCSR